MPKRKKPKKTKTEKADDKLRAALKRFDADQGMVARRNARKALSAALTALRKAVDEEYPTIRKKPKRTGRLSPGMRRRRLRERGWEPVRRDLSSIIQAGGIRTAPDPSGPKPPNPRWAPGWAAHLARLMAQCSEDQRNFYQRQKYWDRARKRGSERKTVEAELHIQVACKTIFRYATIRRVRKDVEFRDAILAAGDIGPIAVRHIVLAQAQPSRTTRNARDDDDDNMLGFIEAA